MAGRGVLMEGLGSIELHAVGIRLLPVSPTMNAAEYATDTAKLGCFLDPSTEGKSLVAAALHRVSRSRTHWQSLETQVPSRRTRPGRPVAWDPSPPVSQPRGDTTHLVGPDPWCLGAGAGGDPGPGPASCRTTKRQPAAGLRLLKRLNHCFV
jgi:hypothetical protein